MIDRNEDDPIQGAAVSDDEPPTIAAERKRGRARRFFPGVGWVRPKRGYVWTIRGDNVRPSPLPAWGSRKLGPPSEWERSE